MRLVCPVLSCLAAAAGILIVNIVARSDSLYAEAIAAIGAVFPVVLEMAVEEDINRIVVAMVTKRTGISSGKKQHRQRERERETETAGSRASCLFFSVRASKRTPARARLLA